jgi:hypothetical protein
MVTFVENYIDEGIEETTVSTVVSIERITTGQVMVKYARRRGNDVVVVAKHVYDYNEYLGVCRMLANLESLLLNELRFDAGDGHRIGAH